MNNFPYKWCRLDELSGIEFHSIIALRESVFIVEQNCPYQDADDYDLHSWHLIFSDGPKIACYLRVVDPGFKYPEPSIGRVITAAAYRGTGLGKRLMEVGIAQTQIAFPQQGIRISAQSRLKSFYENLGFAAVSEEYLEDNIPHIEMLLPGASVAVG